MANLKHRGVKLLTLAGGRVVARWTDPITKKQVQRDLAPLGLTNAERRRLWAIEKATELRALKAQVAVGNAAPARVTIEKAQADYLATFGNVNTVGAKVPPLGSVAEHLAARGVVDVQDITGPALAAWGDHVRRPGSEHKVSTRNWHLMAVAAWLRWCRRRGHLPRVSDDQIKDALKRQKAARDPIEILQPAQVKRLLRACLAHDADGHKAIAPLALVILCTGMRFSEAEGLTWREVDLAERTIKLSSSRTKTATSRTITMVECPLALDVLRALRMRGGDRVFPELSREIAEGGRDRTHDKYSAPTWTWHMLRRTCGSLSVCSGLHGGAGAFLVAKRLGHSLAVAERHYLGAMVNLPKDATSIEQAGGFEAEAREVLRAVGGAADAGRGTAATAAS